MPASTQFVTHVGLIQSPDSVALQYDVPHVVGTRHWTRWRRVSSAWGRWVTMCLSALIRRKNFGNEHSMVRWIRQPRGFLKHDFSIVEKYLDLAVKHFGKPPVVCLYCWILLWRVVVLLEGQQG